MDAFASFTIAFSGKKADSQAIKTALAARLVENYVQKPKKIVVEESYELVYANDVAELAQELAKSAPGIVFTIEGTTDCNGNEFQNFKYQKSEVRLTEQLSDWYYDENEDHVPYSSENVLIGEAAPTAAELQEPIAKTQKQIEKEWKYTLLPDGTVRLDDYLGTDSCIVVPGEINGSTVAELGEGALSTCVDMFGCEIRKLPRGQKKVRKAIKNVILPHALKVIGKAAFQWSPIESIIIPDSVMTIGEKAFDNCKALCEISFGTGLKEIGKEAFSGIHEIRKWYLPNGLETIQTGAFIYSSIEEIHIPASVEEIGKYAIASLWEAKAVVFGKPDSAAEAYAKENGLDFVAE